MASDPNVIAAFGGGMLSFVSPCVLPLVPGYISMISGVSVGELAEQGNLAVRTRVLAPTLLFVAGFTVVFTALGASASALGRLLRDHQSGLNQVAGLVIIVLGLFMAGFVSSTTLSMERRFHVSPSRLGVWAPPITGMAFAFGWTPCIGPILGPVLGLAGNQDTLPKGVLLLLFYSLGLGVPFVLTGLALGRLGGVFGWVKAHYRIINLVSGLLLAGFGVLLLTNNVTWLSSHVSQWMDRLHLDSLTTI